MATRVPDPNPRVVNRSDQTASRPSALRDPVVLVLVLIVLGSLFALVGDVTAVSVSESGSHSPVFPIDELFTGGDMLWL